MPWLDGVHVMSAAHRAIAQQAIAQLEAVTGGVGYQLGALRRQLEEADAAPEAATLQAEHERIAQKLEAMAFTEASRPVMGYRGGMPAHKAKAHQLQWLAQRLKAGVF